MSALTPLDQALQKILASVEPIAQTESVALDAAIGRVLAEDVKSPIDVPGADNSAMDGYALRHADLGQRLPVTQVVAAGTVGETLASGSCARIYTGAPLPEGADTVVMQELCEVDDALLTVTEEAPRPGQHVRRRGEDIAAGACVLSCGHRLRAQDVGMLASVGVAQVDTYRPLKVALLSTGDELVEPGCGPLQPGQLYNSNRAMLMGLLGQLGMEAVSIGIVEDSPQATAEALQRAAASADCIISTGGVSVGDRDYVRDEVTRLGELLLWKLAIKPGKPLAFGHVQQTPFFGLPGNPSSAFVTFVLIARPWLQARQGVSNPGALCVPARAGFSVAKAGTRQDHLRVVLQREGADLIATLAGSQSSGVLSSLCAADALAIIPVGATITPGDPVDVMLMTDLTNA